MPPAVPQLPATTTSGLWIPEPVMEHLASTGDEETAAVTGDALLTDTAVSIQQEHNDNVPGEWVELGETIAQTTHDGAVVADEASYEALLADPTLAKFLETAETSTALSDAVNEDYDFLDTF